MQDCSTLRNTLHDIFEKCKVTCDGDSKPFSILLPTLRLATLMLTSDEAVLLMSKWREASSASLESTDGRGRQPLFAALGYW